MRQAAIVVFIKISFRVIRKIISTRLKTPRNAASNFVQMRVELRYESRVRVLQRPDRPNAKRSLEAMRVEGEAG
jgi:hypothetical protein